MAELPPLSMDAIVKAVARLGPAHEGDREALARALRVRSGKVSAATGPAEAGGGSGRGQVEERGTRRRTARHHRPLRKPPRVIRLFSLPELGSVGAVLPPAGGKPVPLHRSEASPGLAMQRRRDLLTPERTARGLVKALLSSPSPHGPPDFVKLVQCLARGEAVTRLPRRRARGLAGGADLVVDGGAWIDPFRRDAQALIDAVRRIVGSDRLALIEAVDGPPSLAQGEALLGPAGEMLFRPRPGVPLLILSDFGLTSGPGLPPRAGPSAWRRFAGAVRAAGAEAIGLLPFAPDEWPPELARSLSLLHWTPQTSPRAARRARERRAFMPTRPVASREVADSQLHTLALACSAASRVEPELLRALRLRLFPESSPGLEARLWWSGDVASRGAVALTMDPARLREYREALRAKPELARAFFAVREEIAPPPAVLRLKERVLRLATLREPGWRAAIRRELEALLTTLLPAVDDPGPLELDAARYLASALSDLPLRGAEAQVRRDLVFLAARMLGGVPRQGSALGTPSPWLAERLLAPGTRKPVSIAWDEAGLHLDPRGDGRDMIEVTGSPPSVSLVWSPPRGASDWLDLNRPQRVHPRRTDYIEIRSLDGSRWGLEDADAADSLAPLRVFVLVHPEDRDRRAEYFLDRLEQSLRRYAGLPIWAPVLIRQFHAESWNELPSWGDRPRQSGSISAWRAATAVAVTGATAFLILVTKSIMRGDWTDEVLRLIAEQSSRGLRRWPPIAAVDWNRLGGADEFLDGFGLGKVHARRSNLSERQEADAIARQVVRQWRSGPYAETASSLPTPGGFRVHQEDNWLVSALQGMALSFHVNSFEPRSQVNWRKPDPQDWGFRDLTRLGLFAEREVIAERPEQDLAFVGYMAEYVYAGPVSDYLRGIDPFRPRYSAEQIERVLRGEDTDFNVRWQVRYSMQSFGRYGSAGELERFRRRFGSLPDLSEEWKEGPAPWNDPERAARALQPYTSQFDEWRARHAFSFARSRTFPEFMEAYSGLLQHYLRNLARRHPDLEVVLGYPDWLESRGAAREAFPASFLYLNMREGSPKSPKGTVQDSMPIVDFSDFFAVLSDRLALMIRLAAQKQAGTDGETADIAS